MRLTKYPDICERIWEKRPVSKKIKYRVCMEIVVQHKDANGNKEK